MLSMFSTLPTFQSDKSESNVLQEANWIEGKKTMCHETKPVGTQTSPSQETYHLLHAGNLVYFPQGQISVKQGGFLKLWVISRQAHQ
jgi:hypothetical protein